MPGESSPPSRSYPGSYRRPRALVPTLVVLAVLFILFQFFTGIWTDVLWYRSVGFSQVFTTQLTTRLILFFLFGLLMAGAIVARSEEHTSELQSLRHLVCRLLFDKQI